MTSVQLMEVIARSGPEMRRVDSVQVLDGGEGRTMAGIKYPELRDGETVIHTLDGRVYVVEIEAR